MAQTITQIEKVIYTAKAHITGGREGGASRISGNIDVVTNLIDAGATKRGVMVPSKVVLNNSSKLQQEVHR